MQLAEERFLRLVEGAGSLAFVDIEATGLRGDYNSVLCVSVRRWHGKVVTYAVKQPGNDQKVVIATKQALEECDAWVTYYGKGFDLPMLNTRLLRWGVAPIQKRPHIDLYYTLKSNLKTARRSQGHLLSWLGIDTMPEVNPKTGIVELEAQTSMPQKMTVSAEMWNKVLADPRKYMPIMIARCESDVQGLEALYDRTSHLIRSITT